MLFNSYIYIFFFLPVSALIYFALNRYRLIQAGNAWLVLASLFFYAYWNPVFLPLIVGSMLVNYGIGTVLSRNAHGARGLRGGLSRKKILLFGIALNLGFLGYFKYANFFMVNLQWATGWELSALDLTLPLAISFFTFQQIAYLADSYHGLTEEYDFLNYCLFVSFFPQLIAGPIVHHKEMMPQFARLRGKVPHFRNIALGLSIFSIGLFKKVVIADNFAYWATMGFDHAASLQLIEAWGASLSYTFQLYYDFSGYTDMAIGTAYLFNIRLPMNFNSPYKAVNIQDFWRRWHITLSRWLRDYLYVPLGGNRKGETRTYVNLFLTFLLGGLWHGAGWTFVLWGAMHGLGTALHKGWQGLGLRLPRFLGWLLTFLFVHCAWVFFRARSFADAEKVFKGMLGLNGVTLPEWTASLLGPEGEGGLAFGKVLRGIEGGTDTVVWLLLFGLIAVLGKNSMEIGRNFRPNRWYSILVVALFVASVLHLTKMSEFIYFNF